jgi:hypothetical protein
MVNRSAKAGPTIMKIKTIGNINLSFMTVYFPICDLVKTKASATKLLDNPVVTDLNKI